MESGIPTGSEDTARVYGKSERCVSHDQTSSVGSENVLEKSYLLTPGDLQVSDRSLSEELACVERSLGPRCSRIKLIASVSDAQDRVPPRDHYEWL